VSDCIGTIGIMSGCGYTPTPFLWSIVDLAEHECRQAERHGYSIQWVFAGETEHAKARNSLVESTEGDWLFMLDCDHKFSGDILTRLLSAMNALDLYGGERVQALTGVYVTRSRPIIPQLYEWDEETEGVVPVIAYPRESCFPVGAAGAGCLLVRREVFGRIRDELGEKPFDHVYTRFGRLGEDLSFCWRLRRLGVVLWCDPQCVSYHIGAVAYGPGDVTALPGSDITEKRVATIET
jgi:hypothetical protein